METGIILIGHLPLSGVVFQFMYSSLFYLHLKLSCKIFFLILDPAPPPLLYEDNFYSQLYFIII